MHWPRLTHKQMKERILAALAQNLDYRKHHVLGLPASYLDREEFYEDAPFLEDAPYLKALIENPNNIGCHTLAQGETAFAGTQALECELIALIAEEIFRAAPGQFDGYVASGGTEANLEAMWIYRNYFLREHGAKLSEIAVLHSADAHYSVAKGCDVLQLRPLCVPVDDATRAIAESKLRTALDAARDDGVKYLIVLLNMGTTMFGSVDDIDVAGNALDDGGWTYHIHIDGAFGGFIYPFMDANSRLTFANPRVTSIALDAHKMLQAPYGTGIFLIRKSFMRYVLTEEAGYIRGKDYTLIGSRSGANAIAIWMILRTHGSEGWKYKVSKLVARTARLCDRLDTLGIRYYRNPFMNMLAIRAKDIDAKTAEKFYLVPDTYDGAPSWWKIVVMDHVTQGALDAFLNELRR
jgi:glutamate/tyrosine decarboxylase-like PLP-dependent enzyme